MRACWWADPGRRVVLVGAFLRASVGELDAVIGEQGVDPGGHGLDQDTEDVGGDLACCLLVQMGEGELAGVVDSPEQV